MYMKKITSIAALMLSSLILTAQDANTLVLRASYRFTGTPNLETPDRKIQAFFYLDVSTTGAYFYDPMRREGDSLYAADRTNGVPAEEIMGNLFKYKTKNAGFQAEYRFGQASMKILDNLGVYFGYEEKLPLYNWTLQPDTARVLGLLVQKATTRFRGRDFVAWYCPEISLPAGPWKLNGLPGLILKVYDAAQHYTYECAAIEKFTGRSVAMRKIIVTDIRSTTYPEFAKLRRMKAEDPAGFLNTVSPGVSFSPTNTGAGATFQGMKKFNPIELEDK